MYHKACFKIKESVCALRKRTYLGLFISDGMESESALSIVKEAEIFICFGNRYDICAEGKQSLREKFK